MWDFRRRSGQLRGHVGECRGLPHPDDVDSLRAVIAHFETGAQSYETEFRIVRPGGEVRWCAGTAAATVDKGGQIVRVSGVTVDITERKRAEERQNLLTREVDHRPRMHSRSRNRSSD